MFPHKFAPFVLTLFASASISYAESPKSAVLDIGDRRQVFIDGRFLASSNNVKLVAHQPRKTGDYTISADRPWERGGLGPYSSVLKEGDVYKMWYHAMDTKLWHTGPTNGSIC